MIKYLCCHWKNCHDLMSSHSSFSETEAFPSSWSNVTQEQTTLTQQTSTDDITTKEDDKSILAPKLPYLKSSMKSIISRATLPPVLLSNYLVLMIL